MTDEQTIATTQTDESSTPAGTEPSPPAESTDAAAQIEAYRKRQAGAEAARQAAEAKSAELQRKLDAAIAQSGSGSAEAATVASLTEKLRQAEEKAAQADARVEAAKLDAKYPAARKELPEVTDEVRLAKFEAILADPPESPTPRAHNEAKPNGQEKSKKPETAADVEARLLSLPNPW